MKLVNYFFLVFLLLFFSQNSYASEVASLPSYLFNINTTTYPKVAQLFPKLLQKDNHYLNQSTTPTPKLKSRVKPKSIFAFKSNLFSQFKLFLQSITSFFIGSIDDNPSATEPIADENKETENPEQSEAENIPPPGFEGLDMEETNVVDVYFGDLYLGQHTATYTNDTIQFERPLEIANKIPLVSDMKTVTDALTGKINSHADKLCTKKDTPGTPENTCGYIEPEVAGIIFDWGRFQVNLFINPKYIKDIERSIQFLPGSTGGYGYLTSFRGVATQTTSEKGTQQQYTYYNDSVAGYRENNVTASTMFTSGDAEESENSKSGYLKVIKAAFNRESRGKLYQAGILELPSNNILPSDEILGIGFSNSKNTILNLQEFQAAPLILYLNTMSNVQIYRNDQLIWSQVLPMGKQMIDTSSFPSGSYPIQIKMTGNNGQTTQSQQFFNKNTAFPSPYFPDFSITAGIRRNYATDSPDDLFYKYDQQKIFNINYAKGLKYPFGFRMNGLIIDNLKSYFEGGLFYLTEKYNISSGALVSTQKDYGIYANTSYSRENFSNFLYLRKMLAYQDTDSTPNAYDPVSGSVLALSDSISYTYKENNLGGSVSFNQAPDSGAVLSFGFSLSRPLIKRQGFLMSGSLSATRSTKTDTVMLQLNCSLPNNKFRPTFSSAYKEQKTQVQTIQGNSLNGAMSYRHQTEKFTTGFNLNGIKDIQNNTISASGNYDNHTLATSGQVNYSKPDDGSTTMTYTLNFATNVAYTPAGYGISSRGLPLSGVVIKVKDKANGKYKVLIGNTPNTIVEGNNAKALFLSPYNTYDINIVDTDKKNNISIQLESPSNTVTLYPGNIQVLTWEVHPKSILIAKAVNGNRQPLVDYYVTGGVSEDATAEEGFFQIDIIDTTKELILKDEEDKPACKIQLPHLNFKEDYIMLQELVCNPISA